MGSDTIDSRVLIRSCEAYDSEKITRIDHCFTTAVDMAQVIRRRLGMPTPLMAPSDILPLVYNALIASPRKILSLRYLQDIEHFLIRGLQKRISCIKLIIIFFSTELNRPCRLSSLIFSMIPSPRNTGTSACNMLSDGFRPASNHNVVFCT